jgi:hypothetical protein
MVFIHGDSPFTVPIIKDIIGIDKNTHVEALGAILAVWYDISIRSPIINLA